MIGSINYAKEIESKIVLIDEVFEAFGINSFRENTSFLVDSDPYYVKLTSKPPIGNRIPMIIHLAKDGIQIDLDGISESFEWDNQSINNSFEEVRNFIKLLFSSYVLAEYCNKHTIITLFDDKGSFKGRYNLTTSAIGFMDGILKRNCQQRLFFPLFW